MRTHGLLQNPTADLNQVLTREVDQAHTLREGRRFLRRAISKLLHSSAKPSSRATLIGPDGQRLRHFLDVGCSFMPRHLRLDLCGPSHASTVPLKPFHEKPFGTLWFSAAFSHQYLQHQRFAISEVAIIQTDPGRADYFHLNRRKTVSVSIIGNRRPDPEQRAAPLWLSLPAIEAEPRRFGCVDTADGRDYCRRRSRSGTYCRRRSVFRCAAQLKIAVRRASVHHACASTRAPPGAYGGPEPNPGKLRNLRRAEHPRMAAVETLPARL